MIRKLFLFSVSLFILGSCKKENLAERDLGYEYFPVSVGTWWEYQVEEIRIDAQVNQYDTLIYQLHEEIESSFIDNQGRPSLRIERYWRNDTTLPWVIKDVWYSTRTNSTAEKVEEDERFIKMAFPVSSSREWNGNAYNVRPEWTYSYEDIDKPHALPSLYFDSTVTVRQRDNFNLIEFEDVYEVYARNVGLIKRYTVDLDINNFDPTNVRKGYILYQNLIAFGKQ